MEGLDLTPDKVKMLLPAMAVSMKIYSEEGRIVETTAHESVVDMLKADIYPARSWCDEYMKKYGHLYH